MTDEDDLKLAQSRFRLETFILLTCSMINLIVILTIGFLIGPQIDSTYRLTKENHEMNTRNHEILKNFNELLNKSRRTVEKSK
jgi:hypothetical protein